MADRRANPRVLLAFFAVFLAVSSAGCRKLLSRGKDAGAAGGAAGDDASALQQEAAADEQLRAKLNNYVDCINALSNPVLKSRDKLSSYFPNGAITGKELFAEVPKLSPEAAPTCMLHVTMGRSLPPSDPALEQSGMEFADAAAATDELTKQMAAYLDARTYKKDKWAKGKDLYPQLQAAWSRFVAADNALHVAVASVSRPLEERALARIERQDGKKFLWHRKHTILASRALMAASDPVGNDKGIDLALFTQTYADFEKALEALTAYGNEHKADLSDPALSENHSVADANFRTFVSRATELKRAASHYGRCLREAPDKAKRPDGKIDRARVGICSDGTVVWTRSDELIGKFNQLIGAFNSLPFP
jgi:hypothetical protein